MRDVRRLLFITDAVAFGGAEQYIVTHAREAARRGVEPLVCFTREPAEELRERIAAAARLATVQVSSRAAVPVRRLRELLHRAQPDAAIINASGRAGFWAAPWICRWGGIPSAWVHHMVEGRDHRRVRPRLLGGRMEGPALWRVPQCLRHRLAATAATAVIVSNPDDRRSVIRWHGVSSAGLHVIPPGLDCRQFTFDADARRAWRESWGCNDCPERTPVVIGTAARLVEGKGLERLFEAFAVLLLRRVDAWLVIAGTGPLRDRLVERARAFCIQDRLLLAGNVTDMPGFYSGLDLVVLASDTESFGLTLAEAMSCSRAVVATPTAGARLQIEHGRTGWLLDDFAARTLADALGQLAASPDMRRELGQAARSRVTCDFSIAATFRRTLDALQSPRRTLRAAPCLAPSTACSPADSAPQIPGVR